MAAEMKCPNCGLPLRSVDGCGAIVWECPACRGRAATVSSLRKIFSRQIVNSLWQSVWSENRGNISRKCPCCNSAMTEIPAGIPSGDERAVMLDGCKNCQTVWFDSSEFEKLPGVETAESFSGNRVSSLSGKTISDFKADAVPTDMKSIRKEVLFDSKDTPPGVLWKWVAAYFGVPVECDDRPLTRIPWVTYMTAALCTAATLIAMHTGIGAAASDYGFILADPLRFGGMTLLTSFFLHSGLIHLIGNLYFLLVFGDDVESELGHEKTALLMICAAFFGNILHLIGNAASTVPCIGASGAISGILLYYVLQSPDTRMGIIISRGFAPGWFYIKAKNFIVVWIVLQVITAVLQVSRQSDVSGLAHLGGAAAGALFRFLTLRSTSGNALRRHFD